MSKKLIAVAAAAALALTGLVGVAPASANGTLAITGSTGGAGTSASPYTIAVPSANTLVSGTNALTVTVSGLATGDVVRLDATGGFKLVETISGLSSANANLNVSTLGATSYSKTTTTNGDVVVYAYTTGTAAGTIVSSLTRTGLSATNTLHVKGTAGVAYNMGTLNGVPTSLADTKTADLTFTVTDVFGNLVENSNIVVGDTGTSLGAVTWDATAKVYKTTMTSTSDKAFLYSLDFGATDIVGLAKNKDNVSGVVNYSGDAALAAQVAALTAQLAASVSKAKYNKLARKWNRANPNNRVKLAR